MSKNDKREKIKNYKIKRMVQCQQMKERNVNVMDLNNLFNGL